MTRSRKIIFEGGTLTNRPIDSNILTLWVNHGMKRVEMNVGRTPIEQVMQKVDELKEQIGLENIKETHEECPNCSNPLIEIDSTFTCFRCKIQLQGSVNMVTKN